MSDDRHCEEPLARLRASSTRYGDEAIHASGAALDCFAFRFAACSQ
jgi:hypothetical protein